MCGGSEYKRNSSHTAIGILTPAPLSIALFSTWLEHALTLKMSDSVGSTSQYQTSDVVSTASALNETEDPQHLAQCLNASLEDLLRRQEQVLQYSQSLERSNSLATRTTQGYSLPPDLLSVLIINVSDTSRFDCAVNKERRATMELIGIAHRMMSLLPASAVVPDEGQVHHPPASSSTTHLNPSIFPAVNECSSSTVDQPSRAGEPQGQALPFASSASDCPSVPSQADDACPSRQQEDSLTYGRYDTKGSPRPAPWLKGQKRDPPVTNSMSEDTCYEENATGRETMQDAESTLGGSRVSSVQVTSLEPPSARYS